MPGTHVSVIKINGSRETPLMALIHWVRHVNVVGSTTNNIPVQPDLQQLIRCFSFFHSQCFSIIWWHQEFFVLVFIWRLCSLIFSVWHLHLYICVAFMVKSLILTSMRISLGWIQYLYLYNSSIIVRINPVEWLMALESCVETAPSLSYFCNAHIQPPGGCHSHNC